ncbi:MAG: hypothetical protein WAT39_20410 [Planctomycetota bacterium]
MDRTPTRPRLLFLLVPLFALPACGGAGYRRFIKVSPAEATLYMNGERVGSGDNRPYVFDFSQCDRIFVQATHPEYTPVTEEFDREKVEALENVQITLRAR